MALNGDSVTSSCVKERLHSYSPALCFVTLMLLLTIADDDVGAMGAGGGGNKAVLRHRIQAYCNLLGSCDAENTNKIPEKVEESAVCL